MNKEQSADDPSVDLIRVKICLISTISMVAFSVEVHYVNKVFLEAFKQLRQRW